MCRCRRPCPTALAPAVVAVLAVVVVVSVVAVGVVLSNVSVL